jgi:ATP-dependent Clp endopeptidase proteolytic subunit ClpP
VSRSDPRAVQLDTAEIAKLKAETELYRAQAAQTIREHEWNMARAKERRIYDFVGEVDTMEVQAAVDDLNDWCEVSDDPITVRLCSPGGDVFDGLFFFDFLQDVRARGITVTTYAMGYAASMASVLSQAGDVRVIARNAWYMIHEQSTIVLGKAGDIRREAQLMDRLHRQLCWLIAERSRLTADDVRERSTDKDWWMPAEEALEHGFFDELR